MYPFHPYPPCKFTIMEHSVKSVEIVTKEKKAKQQSNDNNISFYTCLIHTIERWLHKLGNISHDETEFQKESKMWHYSV